MNTLNKLKRRWLKHKFPIVFVFENEAVGVANGEHYTLSKQLTKEIIKNKKDQKNRKGESFRIDELQMEEKKDARKLTQPEWQSIFMKPHIIFR